MPEEEKDALLNPKKALDEKMLAKILVYDLKERNGTDLVKKFEKRWPKNGDGDIWQVKELTQLPGERGKMYADKEMM